MDVAIVYARQTSDLIPSYDAATDKAKVAHDGAAAYRREQTDVVGGRPVDREPGYRVTETIEYAAETMTVFVIDGREARTTVPVGRRGGIDIGGQHVIAIADSLKLAQRQDDGKRLWFGTGVGAKEHGAVGRTGGCTG